MIPSKWLARRRTIVALTIKRETAIVHLCGGRRAFIDPDSIPLVRDLSWSAVRLHQKRTWYARASVGGRDVLLHRLVMGESDERVPIDHIDGNGLNNRRSNLARSSPSGNARNFHTIHGRSRFRGVCWHKQNRKWQAAISINRRCLYLGLFHSEEEAARAYDAAAIARDPSAKTNSSTARRSVA